MHQQTPTPINPSPKGFAAETPEISHTHIHNRYECILNPPPPTPPPMHFLIDSMFLFMFIYVLFAIEICKQAIMDYI